MLPERNEQMRSRGGIAQLGERVVRNHEVRGSIPLISTNQKQMPSGICFFFFVRGTVLNLSKMTS